MTTTAPAAPAAPAAEDSQAGPAAPRMHRPRQQPARKRPAVPGEEGTKPKHTHTRHTRGHREHPAHHHRNQPRHPRVPAHEEHKSASSATTTTTTSTTSAVDPSTAEDDDREACLTCCEPIEIHSLGQCNHNNICHLCCLRRRELYKDDQCWCKTKLPQVVFTHDATKTFSDFALDQLATTPKLQGIYFEAEDDRTAALKLWEYSCTVCHSTGFRSLGQLKRHLQEEHRLFFCAVCLEHRAAFTHEQPLFTKNELQRHLQGDKNADDAHQRCEFCNRSFYNKEHLYKHLTEKHESCHICRQQGIYFQYYRDYDDLERHFEKEHFLCSEKECLEKKFVVFRSALDLHAHDVAVHLAHRNMSKEKKREAAKLSLDLVFTDSPSRGVQQRADTAGPAPRRGGRGGGRRGGGRDHYSSGSDEDAPLDESLPTAPRTPNLEEVQSWPTLPGADNAHPTSGGAPRRYAALTRDDWSASRGGGRAPSGVPQGEDRWPTLPGGGAGGGGAKNKKQPARGTSWARSVASGASSSSSSSSSSGPAPVGFSEDPFSWLPPPPSADHYGGNYHHNTTVRPLLGVWGGGNQPAAPAQGGGKKKGKQVLFRVG